MSKNCPSLSPKSSISIFSLQYQHCADSNALNVCRIPSTNSLSLLFPPSPGTSTTPWKTAWQPPCDTHGNRHSICTIGEWQTRRRLLPWSWPGERQRSHQIKSRPATSSQANSRSWWENSWVSWQRTARCRNLRFSWGVSKHSYQKIRSARCGTGTSEVEFTCSKWTAVSGQSRQSLVPVEGVPYAFRLRTSLRMVHKAVLDCKVKLLCLQVRKSFHCYLLKGVCDLEWSM